MTYETDQISISMEELARLRKVDAMFEFLATHASELKIVHDDGGNDWVYNDSRDVETFTTQIANQLDGQFDEDFDDEDDTE